MTPPDKRVTDLTDERIAELRRTLVKHYALSDSEDNEAVRALDELKRRRALDRPQPDSGAARAVAELEAVRVCAQERVESTKDRSTAWDEGYYTAAWAIRGDVDAALNRLRSEPTPSPSAPVEPPASAQGGAGLREAAQAFVDKVQECCDSDSYKRMVSMAAIHGWRHDGPDWTAERDALRAALATPQPAVEGADEPPTTMLEAALDTNKDLRAAVALMRSPSPQAAGGLARLRERMASCIALYQGHEKTNHSDASHWRGRIWMAEYAVQEIDRLQAAAPPDRAEAGGLRRLREWVDEQVRFCCNDSGQHQRFLALRSMKSKMDEIASPPADADALGHDSRYPEQPDSRASEQAREGDTLTWYRNLRTMPSCAFIPGAQDVARVLDALVERALATREEDCPEDRLPQGSEPKDITGCDV